MRTCNCSERDLTRAGVGSRKGWKRECRRYHFPVGSLKKSVSEMNDQLMGRKWFKERILV